MKLDDGKRKTQIQWEASKIRRMIKGAKLYGEMVNLDDADSVIVAAYILGIQQWLETQYRRGGD